MSGVSPASQQQSTSQQTRLKRYDSWEDWDSDLEDALSQGDIGEAKKGIMIALTPDTPRQNQQGQEAAVACQATQNSQKLRRLKSRQRQRAQNARAGIKLVTDMSRLEAQRQTPHYARGNFVDAAAIRALEGEPSSASVGSWNWLKRKGSRKNTHARKPSMRSANTPATADFSPNPAPIMIGISLPSEQVSVLERSPITANTDKPIDIEKFWKSRVNNDATSIKKPCPKSVWSPDTPSTTFSSPGRGSSPSPRGAQVGVAEDVPPVPAVPEAFKIQQTPVDQAKSPEAETPYTPFEEGTISPLSAATTTMTSTKQPPGNGGVYRSGWWDYITSPFAPSPKSAEGEQRTYNPSKALQWKGAMAMQAQRLESETIAQAIVTKNPAGSQSELWSGVDNKKMVPAPLTSPCRIISTVPSMHTVSPISPNEKQTPRDCNDNNTRPSRTAIVSSCCSVSPVTIVSGSSTLAAVSMSNKSSTQTGSGNGQPQLHSEKAHILAEENSATKNNFEYPPPYSYTPPSAPAATSTTKHVADPPTHLHVNTRPMPSPGIVSPAISGTMTSQGAIGMEEIVLTPPPPLPPAMLPTVSGPGTFNLPNRPPGSLPVAHFEDARGTKNRVERKRRRHEKEDAVARRIGGFWRGRGCIPEGGCYGRPGREGRKRRRVICIGIMVAVLLIIALAVTLPLILRNRAATAEEVQSIWLNLTTFPPMPTGILTVTGAEKKAEITSCINLPTMWSCHLPKEDTEVNEPFKTDRPAVIFQVQFDNSSTQEWNVPQGAPPLSGPGHAGLDAGDGIKDTLDKINQTDKVGKRAPSLDIGTSQYPARQDSDLEVPWLVKAGLFGRSLKLFSLFFQSTLRRRSVIKRASEEALFHPRPKTPTFQEMWFLGNTTDGVVSDNKAGEPTPFYISILASLGGGVGSNVLSKRQEPDLGDIGSIFDSIFNKTEKDDGEDLGTGVDVNLTGLLPPPALNSDGTGKKARLLPRPIQQPVRLYDRGLPSEHYGFYTYFDKTIYLKSTDLVSSESELVPEDLEGGSLQSEAEHLVTFSEARFFVRIWTRRENSTRLVGTKDTVPQEDGSIVRPSQALVQAPGTFPYPVTFGIDLHGGNRTRKTVWTYGVEPNQHINITDPKLVLLDLGRTGTWINPRSSGDPVLGGFDGGTGGCMCAWQNFGGLN